MTATGRRAGDGEVLASVEYVGRVWPARALVLGYTFACLVVIGLVVASPGFAFVQQGEPLRASGEVGNGDFGFQVALSADGNTALIGAYGDNNEAGAVWVFTRSGSTWTQQAELTGAGENGPGDFGESVALSADGNTALIGGGSDNNYAGAAWVFTRTGTTWSQQGPKLTGGAGARSFGTSVALSADGSTALIGGPYDNSVGGAWVFSRSVSTWTQQGEKLTGGGEVGHGLFGLSVALASEGSIALVSGENDNNGVGAAWVFSRSGSSWTQQGEKLTGGGEIGEGWFGGERGGLALSSDGNTALISGEQDDYGVGAAWVFTRIGSTWTQQGEKLTGGGEVGNGFFGSSLALSSEGNVALIGGHKDNGNRGAAWEFVRAGSTWTQHGAKLTGEGSGYFGTNVALASGSHTAIVGGTPQPGVGAAWVFVSPPPELGRCVKVASEKVGKTTLYHGGYTSATCLIVSTTKTGKYEWEPGASKAGFTTALKEGLVTLQTVGGTKVTCTTETGSGNFSGTEGVENTALGFTGCESLGHKCTTTGLLEGEVDTKTLEGTLGWQDKELNKVALDLYPVGKTGTVMEYRCVGGVPITVSGSILAPIAVDKMLGTSAVKYAATKGIQKPTHLEDEANDVLAASLNGEASEQLGLSASLTRVSEEPVEINAVF